MRLVKVIMHKEIIKELESLKDLKQKEIYQRFFKTKKGEYGENDIFLGIRVPVLRKLSKKYKDISLYDCEKLLKNKYHEVRMLSLFILVLNYDKYPNEVYNIYLNNKQYINNWDLVDTSSSHIIGKHIYNKKVDNKILYSLISTNSLWNIRIAILATLYLIRNNDFNDIIKIANLFLKKNHDLIDKAVGWMLREIGKRDKDELLKFLNENYKLMPRTMLRYSIEKLESNLKQKYMN